MDHGDITGFLCHAAAEVEQAFRKAALSYLPVL
jgi:hypothetical protein